MCRDCQEIAAACEQLVITTAQEDYILLTDLHPSFPPNLAVTITAGSRHLSAAQAETILSAAIKLLPEFKDDFRLSASNEKFMLVPAFVMRQHPQWQFNNALTLTLWAVPLAQQGRVQLAVRTMLKLIALYGYAFTGHCTMLHYRLSCVCSATLSVSFLWRQQEPLCELHAGLPPAGQHPNKEQSSYSCQQCPGLPASCDPAVQNTRQGACRLALRSNE